MAKSNKEKGLVIGGAIVGLLMGGTAIGATGTVTGTGEFFKFNEVNARYQLAAEQEAEGDEVEVVEEDVEVEDEAADAGDEKAVDAEKKCSEEGKQCGEDKKCSEGSCG